MHMLLRSPLRSAAFGAATLTLMAAAPAQADPMLFIGLQEAGVNGGAPSPSTPAPLLTARFPTATIPA
jgi:hypothetical protein